MQNRPSWAFWISWTVAYTLLDLMILALMHRRLAWSQLPGAIEDAALGATLTWFFALFRYYKMQDRF
jgi:hypothetical protein